MNSTIFFSKTRFIFQVFEQVTIIFNDIPAFLDICTKCDGMKIVTMLNTMFGIFDNLSDRNDVYKVETVKDSFVGVSGAPEKVNRSDYSDEIYLMKI